MALQASPKVIIEEGPNPGQEVSLSKPEFVVGRELGNDLVIASPSVSRRHLRIFLQGSQYLIEDLGSANGTFINNRRISAPTPLQSGDSVYLGKAIRLKIVGLPTSQATPAVAATVADLVSVEPPEAPRETRVVTPERSPLTAVMPDPQPKTAARLSFW
ncbi:MAG: hypothetical protein A2W35_02290 [Chloroflexi bacterium RBG_16_57_11]|nr:MAG: hypothetical protein A2W35_02290 [Chloroflexi bacterium RBG_16_57_11]